MEKILVLVNAHEPEKPAIDFACNIVRKTGSILKGLLVEPVFDRVMHVPGLDGATFYETDIIDNEISEELEKSVQSFTERCKLNGVNAEVQVQPGEQLSE